MSASASGASWCYFPSDYKGYNSGNVQETNLGRTADLNISPSSVALPFPKVLQKLKIDVYQETETRLRVKVGADTSLVEIWKTFDKDNHLHVITTSVVKIITICGEFINV